MYAAQLYNKEENYEFSWIYGAVTTGDEWKFIKLEEKTAYIDHDLYYMSDIKKVIGILVDMAEQKG